jgi:uncharacterized protein YjbJ (UPF0337 family)
MDKDRMAGSVKDFAGKVEGSVGDIAGDAKTQTEGRVREATGTAQNLYGQAKDATREATDAALKYAKDSYENSGDTFHEGSQVIAKKVRDNPPRFAVDRGRDRFCVGAIYVALAATPAAAALAILRLKSPYRNASA